MSGMERCGKIMWKKQFKAWLRQFGLILLILLMTFGTGCKREDKKTTAKEGTKPKVEVKQVVEAYGLIKARDYKDINLDFPAQIVKVPVKNGQNVKKGETLIQLNIGDFLAMIKNKENELNLSRFELKKLQKNLQDAEEAYQKSKRQLTDKENLYKEGVISQKELDDFKDIVKEKEKVITDIQLGLKDLHGVTSIEVQAEKVAVLEYDLQRMKDKLNQSFLIGNTIVSDYTNAVVYDINCAAGYSVGVGEREQKLLSIMNLNDLYVTADVAEEFIKDVKIGALVTIIPVADNTRKYRGKVTRIADMAVKENGETNIAVEISIDNPDSFLRPNFNVDVEIAK